MTTEPTPDVLMSVTMLRPDEKLLLAALRAEGSRSGQYFWKTSER